MKNPRQDLYVISYVIPSVWWDKDTMSRERIALAVVKNSRHRISLLSLFYRFALQRQYCSNLHPEESSENMCGFGEIRKYV